MNPFPSLPGWRRTVIYVVLAVIVAAPIGFAIGRLGWHRTWNIINSGFTVGVLGAGISSYAGAYAAQWIVERKNLREEMLKDIRQTNTGIMIAFGMCNTLVTLKKQHIKRMRETYEQQRKEIFEHRARFRAGQVQPGTMYRYQVDYQTLAMPVMPLELLRTQIFDKLSVIGRPLMLTMQLMESAEGLTGSINLRNHLIDEMRAKGDDVSEDYKMEKYFGMQNLGGHTDHNYPDTITAIYNQTDDGIIFSKLLYEDLIEHGEEIRRRFRKALGREAPPIGKPHFKEAERLGLIPDLKDYADWVNMKKPTAPIP